ncbi:MAG: hypothetical protein U5J98_11125 [Halobacteriales archaeon]|nr:hypothetical protein [Halobacteriales archaeon]
MDPESATDRVIQAGATLQAVLLRVVSAIVVLVMFAGLVYLVDAGSVDADALLLYAGVILGYIIHATKRAAG